MKETTNPNRTAWPTFQADFRRTGYSPDATGPSTASESTWSFETQSPTVHCSPSIADGSVYIASSGTPGYLYALDAATGAKRWRHSLESYATAAPTVTGDRVYFGERGERIYALDRRTGDEVWTTNVGQPIGDSAPVVLDGTLYVGTLGTQPAIVNGDTDESDFAPPSVLALNAETGDEQWQYSDFPTRDSIVTSVAFEDGRVYVASESGIVCALDAKSGDEHWRRTVSGMIFSDVTVADGTVYVGEHESGLLRALDVQTGKDRWTTELEGENVKSSPAVADGTIYLGCHTTVDCLPEADDCEGGDTGYLHAIRSDGSVEWTYETPNDVRSSPAVVENGVFFGRGSGVAGVSLDGKKRWSVEFDGSVKSSPAVADGQVVIGSSDGRVHAVGARP